MDGPGAESAIQRINSPSIPHRLMRDESRFQRWRLGVAHILGRWPQAAYERRAFGARQIRGIATERRLQNKKMPDGLGPSGISFVDLQQRLNCALLVSFPEPRFLSIPKSLTAFLRAGIIAAQKTSKKLRPLTDCDTKSSAK